MKIGLPGSPCTPENLNFVWEGCTFSQFRLFACWMALGCQLGPILGPFWVPSWAKLGTKLPYNASSTQHKKLSDEESILVIKIPKIGCQLGPQGGGSANDVFWCYVGSWGPSGPRWPQEPPRALQDAILGPSWCHLGAILGLLSSAVAVGGRSRWIIYVYIGIC